MNQHFSEAAKLINHSSISDSFANHFEEHFKGDDRDATVHTVRKMVKMEVAWQGSAISCMKERLMILLMGKDKPDKLINSRSEIYGTCRHMTRFHRYTMNGLPSTDEGDTPERALGDLTNANDARIKPPPGGLLFCVAVLSNSLITVVVAVRCFEFRYYLYTALHGIPGRFVANYFSVHPCRTS